jgi:hypothetical protein
MRVVCFLLLGILPGRRFSGWLAYQFLACFWRQCVRHRTDQFIVNDIL